MGMGLGLEPKSTDPFLFSTVAAVKKKKCAEPNRTEPTKKGRLPTDVKAYGTTMEQQ